MSYIQRFVGFLLCICVFLTAACGCPSAPYVWSVGESTTARSAYAWIRRWM